MNYHMIRTDDMLNGDGLRVVLFVSGCSHYCQDCHNMETWDKDSGVEFTNESKQNIIKELSNNYISGITFSGGDPLNKNNLEDVLLLIKDIKLHYPQKSIWLYTGYTWEELKPYESENEIDEQEHYLRVAIVKMCDVVVDGKFEKELFDANYHWCGSTNQRVIDVKKSLENNEIVLWN